MELRQLRYFVTLADELHFVRAAARAHIVQSDLSQQLQRLERELGVRLIDRDTHHVKLTRAGQAFLVEARQIIAHVDRAAEAAKGRTRTTSTLLVGVGDPSYDTMPQILCRTQDRRPDLAIHQVEVGVPQQLEMLQDARLDVGFGRAARIPDSVAAELVRLDPLGVLVPEDHMLTALPSVPLSTLAEEWLLLADEERAPEFNEFTRELCRSVGFIPVYYRGSVGSVRGAHDLVAQGRCLFCVPSSCAHAPPGVIWKLLTEPEAWYPWSLMWRAGDRTHGVRAIVAAARSLSAEMEWLEPGQRYDPRGTLPQ